MAPTISSVLIRADTFFQYVPLLSSCVAAANVVQKALYSTNTSPNSPYIAHILRKSNARIAATALPILGNAALAVHDISVCARPPLPPPEPPHQEAPLPPLPLPPERRPSLEGRNGNGDPLPWNFQRLSSLSTVLKTSADYESGDGLRSAPHPPPPVTDPLEEEQLDEHGRRKGTPYPGTLFPPPFPLLDPQGSSPVSFPPLSTAERRPRQSFWLARRDYPLDRDEIVDDTRSPETSYPLSPLTCLSWGAYIDTPLYPDTCLKIVLSFLSQEASSEVSKEEQITQAIERGLSLSTPEPPELLSLIRAARWEVVPWLSVEELELYETLHQEDPTATQLFPDKEKLFLISLHPDNGGFPIEQMREHPDIEGSLFLTPTTSLGIQKRGILWTCFGYSQGRFCLFETDSIEHLSNFLSYLLSDSEIEAYALRSVHALV